MSSKITQVDDFSELDNATSTTLVSVKMDMVDMRVYSSVGYTRRYRPRCSGGQYRSRTSVPSHLSLEGRLVVLEMAFKQLPSLMSQSGLCILAVADPSSDNFVFFAAVGLPMGVETRCRRTCASMYRDRWASDLGHLH